jgi:hypothetical protein
MDPRLNKMKNFLFPILMAMAFYFVALTSNSVFALDEGGCLTCHQYPGLVRLAKSNGLKVLHIDEIKYFNSPHGKLQCIQCHTTIVKVPHTGETKIDCTTECHKGDKGDKEKKLPENYSLKGFHKEEQSFIADLKDESSCRACHPLYPHSDNTLVRGFLNLHAGFMFCEVCHINRSKFKNISYEWESSEKAEFSGTPFGTFYNPQTKNAHKSKHFISRIAAFATRNGEKRSLTNTWDTSRAKTYVGKEKSLKPDEKEKELAYFHKDIEKKEISVACNECHSKNSILDFQKLGFDEKKTKDLIYLNIKGLVTKYKTFYFPHLFGP